MPISSPSYFPPQRNVDRIVGLNAGIGQTGSRVFLAGFTAGQYMASSDLVVIGSSALNSLTSATAGTDSCQGTIVIGSGAAKALAQSSTQYSASDGGVVIGYNAMPKTISANASVVIGSNTFAQLAPSNAGAAYGGINASVVLGSEHMNGAAALSNNTAAIKESVIIGYSFNANNSYWTGMSDCVVIGSKIANGNYSNSFANSVVIGTSSCAQGMPTYSVVIGNGALPASVNGGATQSVVIGQAAGPNINTGQSCTMIGQNAGNNLVDKTGILVLAANSQNVFLALANPQATGGCNYAFGVSTSIANVNLSAAVNTIFIPDGTVGSANPLGGGYFYVTAGALHWVGSSGSDTQIAPA